MRIHYVHWKTSSVFVHPDSRIHGNCYYVDEQQREWHVETTDVSADGRNLR